MQNADGILDFRMSTSRSPQNPKDPRGATLVATSVTIIQLMILSTGFVVVALTDQGVGVAMQTHRAA